MRDVSVTVTDEQGRPVPLSAIGAAASELNRALLREQTAIAECEAHVVRIFGRARLAEFRSVVARRGGGAATAECVLRRWIGRKP